MIGLRHGQPPDPGPPPPNLSDEEKALREYAANSPDYAAGPINRALDVVEERFGSSVSGGEHE